MRRLLLLAALVLPLAANAADDVSVELISKALAGKGRPGIVLHANRPVAQATLKVSGPGGRSVERKSGRIPPGSSKELLLDAPVGTSAWSGTLSVLFADGGTGEMPVSFEVTVSEGLKIAVPEESLDLKAGTLKLTLTGAADRCEYDVVYDGKPARQGWVRYAGEPAGTPLELSFPKHGDDDVVLRIRLVCHDTAGFFSPTLDLYPWKLAIAHEDVVFPTGKAEIAKQEAPKLDRALKEIEQTLRRYSKALQLDRSRLELFVIGHTDTVGDAAWNQALSLARARSIAGYFRKKGLEIPIRYVGVGESEPAVPTPDETDEVRNRRAQYLIGIEPPAKLPWQKL